MRENTALYRTGLSAAGLIILGSFGLIAGTLWALATGADVLPVTLAAGGVMAVWGMIAVQLTPTGGGIMENKTTVNYSVIALHAWLTFLAGMAALIVWAVRSWAL